MANMYGLVGYPLSHSFSKKYFEDKFITESLVDHRYELFEFKNIKEIKGIIEKNPDLVGLNVTIPHKESIIPFLDHLDDSAKLVGAVNVIKIQNNSLSGYNSDFFGFETSLLNWLPPNTKDFTAVILGTGGAAKAVEAVFRANKIAYRLISRTKTPNTLTYDELIKCSLIADSKLIINTTPLGMTPNINECPDITYDQLSDEHLVYDLIYNPAETKFLAKASAQGAKVKNGLEMLQLQAEKSWEIWTS
jgi:shikimate dehydrogenase